MRGQMAAVEHEKIRGRQCGSDDAHDESPRRGKVNAKRTRGPWGVRMKVEPNYDDEQDGLDEVANERTGQDG